MTLGVEMRVEDKLKSARLLSPAQVIDQVRQSPSARVKVAVSDIDGVLRGKYLSKYKFLDSIDNGFGFCNVVFGWDSSDNCYDNSRWTGWHTGFPDAQAHIDLSTFRRIPWDDDIPFFLADFKLADGKPLPVCPRQVLKRVLKRAADMGFKIMTGIEIEWFNFAETPKSFAEKGYIRPEPITPGMFGYSLIRMNQNQPFFKALMEELPKFDIPIESMHTETGPGVYEAAIQYSEALESGDRAILFKLAAKEIGNRFGIMPSFMAKWSQHYPGCSGHIHQSLTNAEGSDNLFYDSHAPGQMSTLFQSYLAGQLAYMAEFQPLYAPTVNSYKRLVDGYWAPVKSCWGFDNRTASFRVITGTSQLTRLETRCPGADVNPYLALAASISAGLAGIEKGLKLTDAPITGDAAGLEKIPHFARNLQDATANMKQSGLARDWFGDVFVDHFIQTREWEWRQSQDAVTDWELKRYFEII
jgi:glutamine synthetase